MVTKPSTEQTQDFSIHNEDFPALPGPNYKDTTLTNNEESKAVSVSHCRVLSVRVSGEVSPSGKVLTQWDLFFCAELELDKQEHIERRWTQVPRRQDLGAEQQPEERHPGAT